MMPGKVERNILTWGSLQNIKNKMLSSVCQAGYDSRKNT